MSEEANETSTKPGHPITCKCGKELELHSIAGLVQYCPKCGMPWRIASPPSWTMNNTTSSV